MENYKKFTLDSGINLYYIKTEKFKTCTVNISIHRPLNKQDATKNALLPYVLRRGCKEFSNIRSIAQHLENLYGASFNYGVNKKGEDQIIYFNFEAVDDKYILGENELFEKTLSFARNIVFDPVLENGLFKKEYVEQEKQKLKDLINSLINNKMSYAVERCFQEMCKDEAFSIYELGCIDDIDSINAENLYEYYATSIVHSPIDIFVTGNIDENDIYSMVNNLFNIGLHKNISYPVTEIISKVDTIRNVEERLDVSQGKLSLGYRTNVSPDSNNYYALMVYNSILGGGPHSKLFNNVREKMSLAYYVFSRLEKFKGLMIISSGIEVENYEKALNAILTQMKEIEMGEITDDEYTSSIKSIVNSINSLKDNALQVADYYLGQVILSKQDSLEDLINGVIKVKKEDVVSIAKNVKLDTIYFLTSKEKEEV